MWPRCTYLYILYMWYDILLLTKPTLLYIYIYHLPINQASPGTLYSYKNFEGYDKNGKRIEFQRRYSRQHCVALLPKNDIVSNIDQHLGLIQHTDCQSGNPIYCHFITRIVCDLIQKCHPEGPFVCNDSFLSKGEIWKFLISAFDDGWYDDLLYILEIIKFNYLHAFWVFLGC